MMGGCIGQSLFAVTRQARFLPIGFQQKAPAKHGGGFLFLVL